MNQIFSITPYFKDGVWAFDDDSVGLKGELLIAGIPEILEKAMLYFLQKKLTRVTLVISHQPFPGSNVKLDWVREGDGGNWYCWKPLNMEGWLCPALFNYFTAAPKELYVKLVDPEAKND